MQTIIDLFERSVAQYPDNVFLMANTGQGYVGMSYTEAEQKIIGLASGLIQQGLQKGDRVAILSENREEWILADLAILYAGGIVVTLSTKLIKTEDLKARLLNAEPWGIFVSLNEKQKAEVALGESGLSGCKIICFEDETWNILGQQANESPLERNKEIRTEDPALIIYTSGTTGSPKGVVLSHKNNIAHIEKHWPLGDFTSESCTLALLPLDHCLFHAFFYMAMAHGATLAMPQLGRNPLETMLNLTKNIQETHPDILVVVPAMLQTFKFLLTQQRCLGNPTKAKQFFGGRLRYFIAGGALTDAATEQFFLDLNLPIHIGYGMTEATAGVSRSYPAEHRKGSMGRPASLSQEVMIVDEKGEECPTMQNGEILYRGDTLMLGYWHNDQATQEVLTKERWFHTGDLGHLDADGFLYIDGRLKSLLISNSGEKYNPEGIESALQENIPYIRQIMLYNQQSPCTIALIVPDKTQISAALDTRNLSIENEEGKDAVIGFIDESIAQFRKGGAKAGIFPDIWLPATFALLSEPFSAENGLLTHTQKLARYKVANTYKENIAQLFTPQGMNPHNQNNRQALEILWK